MPSPFVHLELADRMAARLTLQPEVRPAFLLGSIAADARLITGQPRDVTHFWDTADDVSGALKLLARHPSLAAAGLPAADRAFIAGYLCHLVADEQWTLVIYRRYFGRRSPFAAGPEGAELQLALGAVMEARQQRPPGHVPRLLAALRPASELGVREDLLPFLGAAALDRWREAVLALGSLAPGAERHAHVDRLIAAVRGPADQGQRRAAFYARLPALQAEAERYVAAEALAAFHRRAVGAGVTLVADYLAGRALRPPPGTAQPPGAAEGATWPAT